MTRTQIIVNAPRAGNVTERPPRLFVLALLPINYRHCCQERAGIAAAKDLALLPRNGGEKSGDIVEDEGGDENEDDDDVEGVERS